LSIPTRDLADQSLILAGHDPAQKPFHLPGEDRQGREQ
jgi:hypothetical protein